MRNLSGSTSLRLAAVPVGLLLASAALAGCGSSSSHSSASAPTSAATSASASGTAGTSSSGAATPSSSAPTTAPAYKPLTKAQLAALLPTAASLPGWKASPSTDTPNDPETVKEDDELAACVGSTNTDDLQVAQASTPDYTLTSAGAVQVIGASATSFKTAAAVTADVNAIKSPRYPACFKKQLAAHGASLFGDGYTYVSSTVVVTPGTTANVAGRIDAVLNLKTAAGKAATFGVTEVAITRPGVEESLTFFAAGKPVSATVAGPFLAQAEASLARGSSTTSA